MQIDIVQAVPLSAPLVVIGTPGTLTGARQLLGTSNQIVVTDGGAGVSVTLSLPQNIHTGASPTFAGMTLSGLTAGRIPIVSTAGLLADDSNLRWDNTLKRVEIGTLLDTPDETSFIVSKGYTTQTLGNLTEMIRVSGQTIGGGNVNTGRVGVSVRMDDGSVVNKAITGAANNGSGLIRITATAHGFPTGMTVNIYDVGGTTEANAAWTITSIDANTFDLQGSTFTNAYTSGGTATNRGLFYGFRVFLFPELDRGSTTNNGDDVVGYAVQNNGTGKATEAIYVAESPQIAGSSYWSVFGNSANADRLLGSGGTHYTAGIDLSTATMSGAAPAIWLGEAHHIQVGTTTGTKIGTSTTQKLGFFNATPIVQPANTTDLRTALINLGLYATGGASPLHLNGGLLTAGTATVVGSLTAGNVLTVASTGQIINVIEGADNATLSRFSTNTGGPALAYRKGRGTAAAPLRTKSGDVIGGFSATGYYAADDVSAATLGTTGSVMRMVAAEDMTLNGQGTYMTFLTAAIGFTGVTERLRLTDIGNLKLGGTANRGTTEGTITLSLFNGTAPVGTLTNGASFYAAAGEMWVIDAGGTATQLSPHDTQGQWVFKSKATGKPRCKQPKTLTIEVERLLRFVNTKYGLDFVHEEGLS